jgi:hypothetical protein
VRERFGASVRAKLFRFLHLFRDGVSMPMTSTSTANKIKSHRDPRLVVGGVDVVATAAGVLTGSEDVLAAVSGVVAAAAGLRTCWQSQRVWC